MMDHKRSSLATALHPDMPGFTLFDRAYQPRGSTSKLLFSTKKSTRFESTEKSGKLVAGRLDSTQSPQQLNYFEAKLVETGGVAWLMAA